MVGNFAFKNELGGEHFPMRMIYLNRNNPGGRFRAELFRRAAELFHLLYYKVYFSRIAARLPLRWRGGLWKTWIRSCGDLRGACKASKLNAD